MTDLHAETPGNSNLCEHYMLVQRVIIEAQADLIADLQRRLRGEPVTREFLNG